MMTKSKFNVPLLSAALMVVAMFFTASCKSDLKSNNQSGSLSKKDVLIDQSEKINWSNPVLIQGSSFGEIINTYYRIGDFEKLYHFTDQETKTKYGKDELKRKWKELRLGMELRLLNKTDDSNIQWLHYETTVDATKGTIRVPVIIEGDSCRIIFELFENEIKNVFNH